MRTLAVIGSFGAVGLWLTGWWLVARSAEDREDGVAFAEISALRAADERLVRAALRAGQGGTTAEVDAQIEALGRAALRVEGWSPGAVDASRVRTAQVLSARGRSGPLRELDESAVEVWASAVERELGAHAGAARERASFADAVLVGTAGGLGVLLLAFVTWQRRSATELRVAVTELDRRHAELAGQSAAREQALRALVVARDQADAASRSKGTFLANMSHEMRTPLNAIIGYAELVQEQVDALTTPVRAELREDLGRIHGAARHLLRLISQVLDLSKVEAGHADIELTTFRVGALLDEVAAAGDAGVARAGNTLSVVCEVADDEALTTDRAKLAEALGNLIDNAGKFTARGAIALTARIEERAGRSWAVFTVQDTGIGIAEPALATLFDAFTQVDGSATRKYGGTGLGLALTRHYASLLQGSVEASSIEGGGSTFTLTIPSLSEEDVPTRIAPGPLADSDELRTGPVELRASPARLRPGVSPSSGPVLVVEDDVAARQLLRRALEREGWEVEEASSGRVALERVLARRPAVMLLDLMMPEMDGFAVIEALRNDPVLSGIPVVVCTAMELDSAARSRLGGAQGVLQKRDLHNPTHIVAGVRGYLDVGPTGNPHVGPTAH